MRLELYKSQAKGKFLIFVATASDARLTQIGGSLRAIGARPVGPRAWTLEQHGNDPESIKNALSELGPDECVYVIKSSDDELECVLVVRQRTSGGVVVSADVQNH